MSQLQNYLKIKLNKERFLFVIIESMMLSLAKKKEKY